MAAEAEMIEDREYLRKYYITLPHNAISRARARVYVSVRVCQSNTPKAVSDFR